MEVIEKMGSIQQAHIRRLRSPKDRSTSDRLRPTVMVHDEGRVVYMKVLYNLALEFTFAAHVMSSAAVSVLHFP